MSFPFLDQEPVVPTALGRMYERPATPELVTPELEEELAVFDSVFVAGNLDPDTFVPTDGRACAVLTLWDDALELRVLQRVGLHVHGEPLVRRIGGGPLRDGPGLQDTVHLESQIPVQRAGMMLLDDENAPLALWPLPEGLRRRSSPGLRRRSSPGLRAVTVGALVAIALELVVGSCRHGSD